MIEAETKEILMLFIRMCKTIGNSNTLFWKAYNYGPLILLADISNLTNVSD